MKISLYASFVILWYSFAESSKEKYNALIFHRNTKSPIEISGVFPGDEKCGEWASACPRHVQTRSFSQNALFVRTIYSEKVLQKDLVVQVCDQPFKLSIAMYNKRPYLYFEFGYEIYFDPKNANEFEPSDEDMYTSFKEVMNLSGSPLKAAKKFLEIPYKAVKSNKKRDKEKDFIWIPLFKVKIMHRELRRIEYDIRQNNRQPMVECQDYDLGKELFHNIDVNEFYQKEIQEKMFKTVKISNSFGDTCKKSFICLEKWLLIPADQFQFGSNTLPSCSSALTVPIWSSTVKEPLKKLDEYLYALSKVTGKPLRIIAGVHKHLLLPPKTWRVGLQKFVTLKYKGVEIYAPRIIYKIVKFKISNGCKNEDGCWHGVMIVIHNNPNFDGKSGLICTDKTTELGWDDIIKIDSPSGKGAQTKSKYIYVCPIRNLTLEKVGLENDGILVRELSLKKFPQLLSKSQNIKDIEYTDIRRLIREMKLSSPSISTSKKTEGKIIERPLMNSDNFAVET